MLSIVQGTKPFIMKNLMSFFAIVSILLLTSCTKDNMLLEPIVDQTTETDEQAYMQDASSTMPMAQARGGSNEIAVTTSSSFQTPTELNISFTSSHDFTSTVIESTQEIDFEDGKGDTVTISFSVNSYSGGNGTLDVTLALGGNDLTGLTIKDAQIVIEDEIII